MNTSNMFTYTILTPLCFAPFSFSDLLNNPTCYTQPLLDNASELLRMYVKLNIMVTEVLFGLIGDYWLPAIYITALGSIFFCIANFMFLETVEEPLTPLESEVVQCIYAHASTGCTTRMLYEYLQGFYEDHDPSTEEITRTLQNLRRRGLVIPVQGTLWLTAGK